MTKTLNQSTTITAQDIMADMFAYIINDCRLDPDWFAKLFVRTGTAQKLERHNDAPWLGKSGVDIADDIFKKTNNRGYITKAAVADKDSPAYWCGKVLGEYQQNGGRKYKDIFAYLTVDDILDNYEVLHQMPREELLQALDKMYNNARNRTNLKILREGKELSRAELASLSGVNIRSIRLYEQRLVNINKAQAQTLYKLSQALECRIEDILESSAPGQEA